MLYDLANTIFALGVIGLYFPAWMSEQGLPDVSLSAVEAAAGLAVVFLAPWAGARSDARGRKVPTLAITTTGAILATAILARGPVGVSFLALGVALVFFNIGSVVYDALLPDVSTPLTRGSVSGIGVGVGYLGSFVGLALGTLALEVWHLGYPATFQLLAGGFLLFALPSFLFIEEPARPSRSAPGLKEVAGRLVRSWRSASHMPGMVRFLVGRFLYTDAINTLIGGFLAIYAINELGLTSSQTRNLLGVAIAAAIPGGLLSGRAVRRFGALAVLEGALLTWITALLVGILAGATHTVWPAWVLAPLGGIALGSTWTADRVLMTELSPPEALGEMYGLYATVGRFATILGPLVWALIVDGLHLSREWALGALAVFVTAAAVVIFGLRRVDQIRRSSV